MPHPREFRTALSRYTGDGVPLGEGGAGIVFGVRDEDGQDLAVKVFRPKVRSRDSLRRFKNEIGFLQANGHRNVVRVLDSGLVEFEGSECPFFVMPRFPETLRTLMDENGGIEPARVLSLFDQLLSGVEALHLKGIVHRDLKPKNVLVDPANDLLVVSDLGIADGPSDLQVTTVETGPSDRLAGLYAAPEQLLPRPRADFRSDIFSLGLILSEMFTHQVPRGLDPRPISAVAPEYSYVDELVRSLIQHEPENRPPSILEVKRRLIGLGSAFVLLQRQRKLDGAVVPSASPDDPFADNPVQLMGFQYLHGGKLELRLNREVTPAWQLVLRQAGFTHNMHHPPSEAKFVGTKAVFDSVDPSQAQSVIDRFKDWLQQMPERFAHYVTREAEERERQERGRLAAAQQQEETLRRINESLRI